MADESPIDKFKLALTGATRALAHDPEVEVSFTADAASEQGSRMTAMDNATRNAGEMIDRLTIEFNRTRQAVIDDVAGILELITPLEQADILVRRSRELLEMEIDRFTVMERDGMIIACAALFCFEKEKCCELACLAVHTDYREHGRGNELMQHIEWQARKQHMEEMFTLTTQTMHWFQERGFKRSDLSILPKKRRALYNYQRNSKVAVKAV